MVPVTSARVPLLYLQRYARYDRCTRQQWVHMFSSPFASDQNKLRSIPVKPMITWLILPCVDKTWYLICSAKLRYYASNSIHIFKTTHSLTSTRYISHIISSIKLVDFHVPRKALRGAQGCRVLENHADQILLRHRSAPLSSRATSLDSPSDSHIE